MRRYSAVGKRRSVRAVLVVLAVGLVPASVGAKPDRMIARLGAEDSVFWSVPDPVNGSKRLSPDCVCELPSTTRT
jgi:hypothetical protein